MWTGNLIFHQKNWQLIIITLALAFKFVYTQNQIFCNKKERAKNRQEELFCPCLYLAISQYLLTFVFLPAWQEHKNLQLLWYLPKLPFLLAVVINQNFFATQKKIQILTTLLPHISNRKLTFRKNSKHFLLGFSTWKKWRVSKKSSYVSLGF